MNVKIIGALMIAGMVFALAGCGGGGGGGAAQTATTSYSVASSPGAPNTAAFDSRPESATTSYTVSGLPAPTAAELAQLEGLDSSIFAARAAQASGGAACTPGASYGDYLSLIALFYNSFRTNAAWPAGTNNLPAAFRSSKSARDAGYFNIFECAEDEINALAGYRNVYIYDGMIELLDEATDLVYLVDSETEYNYYLGKIIENAKAGRHWQVVTPALHNALSKDPKYGEDAMILFLDTLAMAAGHEIGHLSMAHSIQKLRLSSSKGVSFHNAALSWGHEFQADIYSAMLLKLGEEDLVAADLMFYIFENIGENPLAELVTSPVTAHPPLANRRYVVSKVGTGEIASSALTPLYTYARVAAKEERAARWEGVGKLRKKLLPVE